MRLVLVANAHPGASDRWRPGRPEHHAGTEVLRLVEARRDLGRRRAGLNDRNPDALDRVRAQEQRLVLRLPREPPGPALRNHEGHEVAGGLDPGATGVRLVRLQLLGGCGHHRQRERQDEDERADHECVEKRRKFPPSGIPKTRAIAAPTAPLTDTARTTGVSRDFRRATKRWTVALARTVRPT